MSEASATVSPMSEQLLRDILSELKKANKNLEKLISKTEDVERAVWEHD